MNDIRPQIAIKLKLAMHDHARAFPHGDWRAVNDRLGALRLLAMNIEPRTYGMGNEMCADYLRAEWEAA